jgi:hypothetical protein
MQRRDAAAALPHAGAGAIADNNTTWTPNKLVPSTEAGSLERGKARPGQGFTTCMHRARATRRLKLSSWVRCTLILLRRVWPPIPTHYPSKRPGRRRWFLASRPLCPGARKHHNHLPPSNLTKSVVKTALNMDVGPSCGFIAMECSCGPPLIASKALSVRFLFGG